jgi:hypothetical protein
MSSRPAQTGVTPASLSPYREAHPAVGGSLALNFFPVTFSAPQVSVWAGLWTTPEAQGTLEAEHSGLRTWRDRDDGTRLYAWYPPDQAGASPAGFKVVTVAFEESPVLFQRLLDDTVRTRLRLRGFVEKGGGFVNYEKPGLIAKVPALATVAETAPGAIDIYPKIVHDVFFTRDATGSLVMGLVVDVLYTTRMEVTAAEWAAAGVNAKLRGTYVSLIAGAPEAERFPDLVGKTVGKVSDLRGEQCVLADLRDPTFSSAALTSLAPEPTRANLAIYLMARYEKAYAAGEKALTDKLRELVRPKTRYDYARAVVRQRLQPLQGQTAEGLPLLGDVRVSFGDAQRGGTTAFPVQRIPDPEYSFDPVEPRYARRVDTGLRTNGPYDQQQRRREPARLLVVAPVEHKGEVTLAMQKLLNGVKSERPVFDGLKSMYRLNQLEVTYAFAEQGPGSPMTRYSRAYQQALKDAPPRPAGEPRFHLVLAIIRAAHRDLPDSENPYFQMKAQALVNDHVPTQMVTLEKLRADDGNLQYTLNTMAVAMYAKLGGTSHVLKMPTVDPDAPTELVFGVGRSVRKEGRRFGEREETVGFATVFRANGEYLFNDCTPYCADDQYERALEETIRRTVQRVAAYEQLEDGAPLRLIFHVPRRPGRHEENAILNAVGKLPRFQIEFALVHVNDDHHLHVFDTANLKPVAQSGLGRGRAKPEAALLPSRGYAVAIGPRERLVTFVGVDQYRGNGSPTPLRVTLDSRSTFPDVDYVTRQLFWLSFMSAGSLNPGITPVTINYAEMIARLTGHLRGVSEWNVGLIQDRLAQKLWFI